MIQTKGGVQFDANPLQVRTDTNKSNEYNSIADYFYEDKVMNSWKRKRDRRAGVVRVQGFKGNFDWPLIDNNDYGK